MKITSITGLLFLSFLLISCSSSDSDQTQKPTPNRTLEYTAEVSFGQAESSSDTSIKVAVADTEQSRNEGLMDVTDLPENNGMLFIFEDEQPRSFWMANTPLSLDILYIDSDFRIVRIHQNTPPYSQQSIESERPAKYVVEVNAGFTLRHDITEGMQIEITPIP